MKEAGIWHWALGSTIILGLGGYKLAVAVDEGSSQRGVSLHSWDHGRRLLGLRLHAPPSSQSPGQSLSRASEVGLCRDLRSELKLNQDSLRSGRRRPAAYRHGSRGHGLLRWTIDGGYLRRRGVGGNSAGRPEQDVRNGPITRRWLRRRLRWSGWWLWRLRRRWLRRRRRWLRGRRRLWRRRMWGLCGG